MQIERHPVALVPPNVGECVFCAKLQRQANLSALRLES